MAVTGVYIQILSTHYASKNAIKCHACLTYFHIASILRILGVKKKQTLEELRVSQLSPKNPLVVPTMISWGRASRGS